MDKIKEKYKINVPIGYKNIVIIDNAPIVDDKKSEKLLAVLTKIFKNVGKINNIHMPMENGKSFGFLFMEFESDEMALLAIKQGNGYKLDKNHTLAVDKFDDLPLLMEMDDEYLEPKINDFVEKEHLKSWLSDSKARDQFLVFKGNDVAVLWNNKSDLPDKVLEKTNMTVDDKIFWSPNGSYLATFHRQGIELYGGESWARLARFSHPKVSNAQFSPNEKYLVTYSREGTLAQGHNLAVWDASSGLLLRTFSDESGTWPIFKWSFDDLYLARQVKNSISIYETPGMGLLDKKSHKVENLKEFFWSPNQHVIVYWTPEDGNIPARVTLLNIPSKEILRTKNLFGVLDCQLYWQQSGNYLLVKIDRQKTKKQIQTSFEIFRIQEKDIPVDVLEFPLSDELMSIYWNPCGNSFVALCRQGPKTIAHFYQVETGGISVGTKHVMQVDAKSINSIFWSPKGRFLVMAGIRGTGDVQFWDAEEGTLLSTREHYMCTDVEWDPSGRYVATSACKVSSDTGTIIWTFVGQEISRQNIPLLKQFSWRPRPKTLLTSEQQENILKNLKEYSKDFDAQDAKESNKAFENVQQRRRRQLQEYREFIEKTTARYTERKQERIKVFGYDIDAPRDDIEETEEWIEVVVQEKMEKLE